MVHINVIKHFDYYARQPSEGQATEAQLTQVDVI